MPTTRNSATSAITRSSFLIFADARLLVFRFLGYKRPHPCVNNRGENGRGVQERPRLTQVRFAAGDKPTTMRVTWASLRGQTIRDFL